MTLLDVRRRRREVPRRVAMLSVHTSPLDQPGTGDAGGLNVYVVELSRQLAARGTEVEIFTRSSRRGLPPTVELAPGITVRNVTAGPYEGLAKADLPGQLCAFTAGVLRAEAVREPGWYDLVHSHYWLSGQVGWLAAERWQVPLVHSMHTMARVKNLALAAGDVPEPRSRVIGETQVVEAADRLVANTDDEAGALVELYGAEPRRVLTVPPGVDLGTFRPAPGAAALGGRDPVSRLDRQALGLPPDALVLLFVGRIQPLKAPDVLIRAAATLVAREPSLRDRLVVAVLGGRSGSGATEPAALQALATSLGIGDLVRFHPPVAREELARWYRAADLTVVPSYNESFGLVALESQACGTPVVASAVGGLTTAVAAGRSGVLVDGHAVADYARVLADLAHDPARRQELARGAVAHAAGFGWERTADRMLEVYADARRELAVGAQLAVSG